jgi:hypothetical protein
VVRGLGLVFWRVLEDVVEGFVDLEEVVEEVVE